MGKCSECSWNDGIVGVDEDVNWTYRGLLEANNEEDEEGEFQSATVETRAAEVENLEPTMVPQCDPKSSNGRIDPPISPLFIQRRLSNTALLYFSSHWIFWRPRSREAREGSSAFVVVRNFSVNFGTETPHVSNTKVYNFLSYQINFGIHKFTKLFAVCFKSSFYPMSRHSPVDL